MKSTIILFAFFFFISISSAQSYTFETAPNDSLKFRIALSFYLDYHHNHQYTQAMEYWEKCVKLDVQKSKGFYFRGRRTLRKIINTESSENRRKELVERLFEVWELQKNDIGLTEQEQIRFESDKELLSY